jgi:hypothetical protein
VSQGALLFTRVVTVDGASIMTGCAPLVIPPNWHLKILDCRKRYAGENGGFLTVEKVRDLDLELRDLYFYIEDMVWNPPLPEIRNTDGDPLVLGTLTYRLQCTPSEAFHRLKSLARMPRNDIAQLLSEAALDGDGQLRAITFPWIRKRDRADGDDVTTLGTLDIDGDRLRVEVNSERRARRIEREITKRLGAYAVPESRTTEPIERLLEERAANPRDPVADRQQEELQQQPEVQEYFRQQADRHWEEWLDARLPALDDRTPREATRTAEGRERLEALLAEFAWMAERHPNPMTPDVSALRTKLGLS